MNDAIRLYRENEERQRARCMERMQNTQVRMAKFRRMQRKEKTKKISAEIREFVHVWHGFKR